MSQTQKKIILDAVVIAAACLIIVIAFSLMKHHDDRLLGGEISYKPNNTKVIEQTQSVTDDERRVARVFAADTLPALIQKGLVKKYERTDAGTLIAVSAKIWRNRSDFFKRSFLTAVFIDNKVHGYELRSRVVDAVTGKLFAQVLPSFTMQFYD